MMNLKSENQLFRKYTKELRSVKAKSIEESLRQLHHHSGGSGDEKKLDSLLDELLNGNLNNYFYSYGNI